MPAIEMPSAAPYEHWLTLSTSDWEKVFRYIPMLEVDFDRQEPLLEETTHPGLDDLKWALYLDLAFLGLVYDIEVDQELMEKIQDPCAIGESDYLTLCKVLALATQGDNFSNGTFESKIKDKTILRILKALRNSRFS